MSSVANNFLKLQIFTAFFFFAEHAWNHYEGVPRGRQRRSGAGDLFRVNRRPDASRPCSPSLTLPLTIGQPQGSMKIIRIPQKTPFFMVEGYNDSFLRLKKYNQTICDFVHVVTTFQENPVETVVALANPFLFLSSRQGKMNWNVSFQAWNFGFFWCFQIPFLLSDFQKGGGTPQQWCSATIRELVVWDDHYARSRFDRLAHYCASHLPCLKNV